MAPLYSIAEKLKPSVLLSAFVCMSTAQKGSKGTNTEKRTDDVEYAKVLYIS